MVGATSCCVTQPTPQCAQAAENVHFVREFIQGRCSRAVYAAMLKEIDAVKAINHVLGVIFGVIAGAALVGCIASLIGAFLANIDRKRRSLALLRLLGFQRAAVAGYLVLQALFLSGAGYLGGLACYGIGSQLFNRLLGNSQATGAFVCDITFWHGLIALLLALLVAALVALIGALRAISIEPAESLREL